MTHFPIWFHGRIPLADITEALAARGIHLRTEGAGRWVAEQVPHSVAKNPPLPPAALPASELPPFLLKDEKVVSIAKGRKK